jgi:geranylgeranyl diphosphate synthase type I
MKLKDHTTIMLPAIEAELKHQVSRLDQPRTHFFHEMLTYHMGWTDEGAGPEATGKRIRPLLVLLTTAASGGKWEGALPAAAAVELVHNFSLVHDDIQDNSPMRRGRSTVWTKWGMPMGINVGDALFVLSNLAILDLTENYEPHVVIEAGKLLQQTCLDLTCGQFMDMSYEDRNDIKVDDYWPMISGKTAALLSACCHLGAILAATDESTREAYRSFGHYLGLAFQVQDDILGIWGNEAITGKSTASDLVEGKKSLPIIVGLSKMGKFAKRWAEGPIKPTETEELARELASASAYEYTHEAVKQMTDLAINSLREADPQGEAGDALTELASKLLQRTA